MFELPKSDFWDFSLAVYKRAEVSELCLQLQDDYGADINMLLFACWLGKSGRGTVSTSAWRAMILRTTKWRDKVIRPLRSVRHILKDEQLAPFSMKDNILKCEFDAEHIEQLILEKEWGTTRRSHERSIVQQIEDIADNLYSYLVAEDIDVDGKLTIRCERLIRLITGYKDDKTLRAISKQSQTTCLEGARAG